MQILYVILEINKPKSVFVCLSFYSDWLTYETSSLSSFTFFELFVQSMKGSSFSMSSIIKKQDESIP